MSSLIYLHCIPFLEFEWRFDNMFNARFCPSASMAEARRVATQVTQGPGPFRPRMDVKEADDSGTITATFELPGLKSEDVTIDLQQNKLTVSGQSTASDSHEESGYAVRERRYGRFSRMLQLPFGTKLGDVKAELANGLLSVTFPKTNPEQQSQRITIQ